MRVVLACCPSWSNEFPPYGISLLKSILLRAGHDVKTFDFNIDAYQFLKDDEIDFWGGQNFFYWEGGEFDRFILPKIDSLMDQWVDSILEFSPDFVGFTVYHTSIRCVQYMAKRIRNRDSSIKIVLGGPQCFTAGQYPPFLGIADYISTSEGESVILKMLEYPENRALTPLKLTKINDLPIPNYEDYDLTKYRKRKGISMEASRGCIAKCAFCIETHYWAYRSKKAEVIVNEIKEYIKKYGAKHFRFNDSLVNGNIKEFYKLVSILSEENLGITWDGYARIDGKMDLDFMKKIKASGNQHLSYGVETGSQKVLDSMKKGITVEEVEQNLIDGEKAGVIAHINWMVGFPTENVIDHLYSLAFLFNNRKLMNGISPGMTCGVGDKAELKVYGERFDILKDFYWNNFVTKDFKNTAIHRFVRLKCVHIWLGWLGIFNGQNHENLKDHYSVEFKNKEPIIDRVDYKDCIDFSPQLDKGTFETSFYAEYMSFFWAVYKVYGPYKMTLVFDKDKDIAEFGSMIAKEYSSKSTFEIDENGKWDFTLHHKVEKHLEFDNSVSMEGVF